MTIHINTLSDLKQAAKKFVEAMNGYNVFAFHAPMGAGKTTLISAICQEMGVGDVVSSPTFAIVNEYEASQNRIISHFDFYRMNRVDEVIDMGAEDYFYGNKICFIEWPDIADDILPIDTVHVYISVDSNGGRMVELKYPND